MVQEVATYDRTSFECIFKEKEKLEDVFVVKQSWKKTRMLISSVIYVFDNDVLKVVVAADTKKPHTYYLQTPVMKDDKLTGYLEEASFVGENGFLKDGSNRQVCIRRGYRQEQTRLYPHTSFVSKEVTDVIKATLETTPIICYNLSSGTLDFVKKCLPFNFDPNFKSIAMKSTLESSDQSVSFDHYISIVLAALPSQRFFEKEMKLKHTRAFVAMHAFGFLLGLLTIYMGSRVDPVEDPLTMGFLMTIASVFSVICFVGIGRDSLITKEVAQERCFQSLSSRTLPNYVLTRFMHCMFQNAEATEEEYERRKERVKQIAKDIHPEILNSRILAKHNEPYEKIRTKAIKRKAKKSEKRMKSELRRALGAEVYIEMEERRQENPIYGVNIEDEITHF